MFSSRTRTFVPSSEDSGLLSREGRKFEVEGERLQRKFVTTHLLESDCAHGAQDKIPREIAARHQMNIHYPLQNEAQVVWSGVWPILADGVGLTDGRAVPLLPHPKCGAELW